MAASASFINKGPSMDWSTDNNLYSRFKMWKQRCELLFTGPMTKIEEEVQWKHLLYWSGKHGMELIIAKLRSLVKEANYPAEHHNRFLRAFMVLGMNSDHVRKDCFKK